MSNCAKMGAGTSEKHFADMGKKKRETKGPLWSPHVVQQCHGPREGKESTAIIVMECP